MGVASAYLDLRGMVKGGFAGDWIVTLENAGKARQAYYEGKEPQYIPVLSESSENPWIVAGREYYMTSRGAHPNWANKTLLWSYDKMAQYSALDVIDMIAPHAILIIAGSKAETLEQSKMAFERAKQPKELLIIDGGTHFDFYDQEHYVGQAVEKFDDFFKQHLHMEVQAKVGV